MILPRSAMTFVSNDPAFRAAYGATVFVGDRFTGDLAASAHAHPDPARRLHRRQRHLRRRRLAGPRPAGQSLELADLAADNNDGANWALSTGSGTPGTTSGGPVVTAPGAPTIGTATAGNASATVRWTAPADNGGSAITGYSGPGRSTPPSTQVGALRPAGAGATSLAVTGLTNGTAYHFQVAATNSVGTGAFSGSSNTVTPTAGATVPGPPVIGDAQPGRRRRRPDRRSPAGPHRPAPAAPPSPATSSPHCG